MGNDFFEFPKYCIGVIGLGYLFVDVFHRLIVRDDFIGLVAIASNQKLDKIRVGSQRVAVLINLLDNLLNNLSSETLATFIGFGQVGSINHVVWVQELGVTFECCTIQRKFFKRLSAWRRLDDFNNF